MIKHYIVLGSSYKSGKRIGIDFTDINDDFKELINMLKEKKEINENFSIATHTISTKTEKWKDVVELDPFFDNVKLLKNPAEFLKCLSEDSEITAIDVANYILSMFKCTHTRLEKLVYYCYADYLCKYNKKLFNDKIYAFKYGPVIETLYEIYKKNSSMFVDKIPQTSANKISSEYQLPLNSRIMNSSDGIRKINSIHNTLEKYKNYNTNTIISFTHRANTPWAVNDKGEIPYKVISDADILKYHKFEEV